MDQNLSPLCFYYAIAGFVSETILVFTTLLSNSEDFILASSPKHTIRDTKVIYMVLIAICTEKARVNSETRGYDIGYEKNTS
jgi:hypothetical protein